MAQVNNGNNNSDNADDKINQNIEILSEQNQTEDADYTQLIEMWNYYKSHPINLNKTTKEELSELQLLNDIQIANLLNHLSKNGYLLTIYELQSVDGFDVETIKQILPFVYVSDNFSSAFFNIHELFKDGRHEVVTRVQTILEKQSGYFTPDSLTKIKSPNSYYLGDPTRIFTRYRFTFNNNVSVALSGEKDPGEEFFKGSQKQGFDFYSGHVAIRNIRFIKTLVIGDYQTSFGQGLTLWNGFAFGKSATVTSIKRSAYGIKPYYSFDENRFFRGVASTVKLKSFEITGLISHKKIDANPNRVDTLSNGELDVVGVSSLEVGGLHNTNGLIADKGTITQTIIGGNISYVKKNLRVGSTFSNMLLSAELTKGNELYNQYIFQGKTNTNVGVDYNYVFKNMNLFGEAAISKNGGTAFVQGLILMLDPKLTFTALYRHFDKKHQSLYASAVSENTLPQNENGIYLGMEAKLPRFFTLSAYIDQFKFPWLKFGVSAPSQGKDIFAQLNFTPTKKLDMYIRYRERTRFENSDDDNYYDYLVPVYQKNIRYNFSMQILPSVKLKSRVEYINYNPSNAQSEEGIAFVQDLSYKKIGLPFTLTLRYALFDTKSYNSRVYVYENDVLYSFSIPALYNKGQRVYAMVNWDVTKHFEIWVLVAQTVYDNETKISEGSLNEILGNKKTELKFQARFKF